MQFYNSENFTHRFNLTNFLSILNIFALVTLFDIRKNSPEQNFQIFDYKLDQVRFNFPPDSQSRIWLISDWFKLFDCSRATSRRYHYKKTDLSDFPHTLKEFRFLYWLHPFCSNDSAIWLIFLQFYFPNGLIVLSNHNLLPPKPKLINIHVRYYVN